MSDDVPKEAGIYWARLCSDSGEWEPVEVVVDAGFYWTLADNEYYPLADVEEWGPPCRLDDSLLRQRIEARVFQLRSTVYAGDCDRKAISELERLLKEGPDE